MPCDRGHQGRARQVHGRRGPVPDICNAFLTGAGSRAEHYEIAAYNGAITLANGLGEDDVVELLKKNLADEQKALKKLETVAERLASAKTPA